MEERSLDEFVTEGSTKEPQSGESDARETAQTPEEIEPAMATARVVPGGIACDDCGETVARVWTDDDGRVCRACKEW